MKKNFKKTFSLMILLFILILPAIIFVGNNQANAQNEESETVVANNPILNNMSTVGEFSDFQDADETSASTIAGTIVSASLSLLGLIFVILIIYAGFMWMTAQGDESKVEKAKIIIKNSIIGLIILVSSVAIGYFVMSIFRG